MATAPFKSSGQSGSRDEHQMVSWDVPWYVESSADVFDVGDEPPLVGLVETGRNFSQVEGAGLIVTITYEGYAGEHESPEDEEPIYSFDSSFKEEPIEAHPDFPAIKKRYEGTFDPEDKTTKWPEFLSTAASKTGLFGPNDVVKGGGEKNPMFGNETFLSFASVFRKSYIREELPPNMLDGIGTIVTSLPRGYPTPDGRDWLQMPPRIRERGEFFQVDEEMILSPAGGWTPEVYGLIQL